MSLYQQALTQSQENANKEANLQRLAEHYALRILKPHVLNTKFQSPYQAGLVLGRLELEKTGYGR